MGISRPFLQEVGWMASLQPDWSKKDENMTGRNGEGETRGRGERMKRRQKDETVKRYFSPIRRVSDSCFCPLFLVAGSPCHRVIFSFLMIESAEVSVFSEPVHGLGQGFFDGTGAKSQKAFCLFCGKEHPFPGQPHTVEGDPWFPAFHHPGTGF